MTSIAVGQLPPVSGLPQDPQAAADELARQYAAAARPLLVAAGLKFHYVAFGIDYRSDAPYRSSSMTFWFGPDSTSRRAEIERALGAAAASAGWLPYGKSHGVLLAKGPFLLDLGPGQDGMYLTFTSKLVPDYVALDRRSAVPELEDLRVPGATPPTWVR